MKYVCVISLVTNPEQESIVIVEAPDKAQALIINYVERPGTYVKSIQEYVE